MSMGTIIIIILTALVIGFVLRATKLYKLINRTLYCLSLKKDVTPTMMQFQNASVGCLGVICIPGMCFFFITPIFLFFKVDWWIPIVALCAGLTLGNLIGYIIERILQLPNHDTYGGDFLDLNALELTMDNGKLYRRATWLMILYSFTSFIISMIIMFNV